MTGLSTNLSVPEIPSRIPTQEYRKGGSTPCPYYAVTLGCPTALLTPI